MTRRPRAVLPLIGNEILSKRPGPSQLKAIRFCLKPYELLWACMNAQDVAHRRLSHEELNSSPKEDNAEVAAYASD